MSHKTGLVAVAALATGIVIGNADRLFDTFTKSTAQQAENFDDNAWRKDPHVALQEVFLDDVKAFAETVKRNMPSRDKALEHHQAITNTCDFYKAVNYGMSYAFYIHSQESARSCLTAVEKAAIETKTKYDTEFAERVYQYTRTRTPESLRPPAFVPQQ